MTERELDVLEAIERRLDTVAHRVGRLGEKYSLTPRYKTRKIQGRRWITPLVLLRWVR